MKSATKNSDEKNVFLKISLENLKWEKIIFLIIILCQFSLLFGQKKIEYTWGKWNVSPCFSGIEYRVKFGGKQNDKSGLNRWIIQLKNNYSKDVRFSYAIGDNTQDLDYAISDSYAGSKKSRKTGGAYHSGFLKANTISPPCGEIDFKSGPNDKIMVAIGKIQFATANGTNKWELYYAGCESGGVCYLCAKSPTTMCGNFDPYKQTKSSQNIEKKSTSKQKKLDGKELVNIINNHALTPDFVQKYFKEFFIDLGYSFIAEGELGSGVFRDNRYVKFQGINIEISNTLYNGKFVPYHLYIRCNSAVLVLELKDKLKELDKIKYITEENFPNSPQYIIYYKNELEYE